MRHQPDTFHSKSTVLLRFLLLAAIGLGSTLAAAQNAPEAPNQAEATDVPTTPAPPAQEPLAKPKQSCAKPVYPRASLRHEQQGTVTLAFLIGTDGTVQDSRIVKSSGFPLLDTAAVEGISKCQFKPARENDAPKAAWMRMQYVWSLR
ncbi:MAG: energy transducer TonB [Pseudomonadota bacterium]